MRWGGKGGFGLATHLTLSRFLQYGLCALSEPAEQTPGWPAGRGRRAVHRRVAESHRPARHLHQVVEMCVSHVCDMRVPCVPRVRPYVCHAYYARARHLYQVVEVALAMLETCVSHA